MRLPVLTLMALLLAGTRAGAQPSAEKEIGRAHV
ncbi:MAG: hypothetical protein RL409_2850 [Gemmatimonadota bacterium]